MIIHHVVIAALLAATPAPNSGLTTEFERSGGTRTGTYDEAIALCGEFEHASRLIHFETFGESGEGRPLPVLIVDRNGHYEPESVRRSGNAVVLIQAGIHAGEIDGKDAGFMLVREMAIEGTKRHLLDHVTVVFIPIYNVDGHERTSPFNRPNQNGPESMGFRTNAANLNLNRDYLKADAPETRAWLGLFNRWQPDIFIDCHVTDGADYQHVVTYAVETWQNADTDIGKWTTGRFIPSLEKRMAEAGYPMAPYCDFRNWHDPLSGLNYWVAPPRFSTGYAAIRNRVALLVETHMLKDYATRVRGTYHMLISALSIANEEFDTLHETVARSDRAVTDEAYRRSPLPLTWKISYEESTMIDFLGFEYSVEKSDITGGDWYRYTTKPATLRVPYFNSPEIASEAALPEAYVIPPQWTEAIRRVHDHGLASVKLREAVTVPVSAVRFRNVSWAATPYESHHPLTYEWDEIMEERTLAAGTVIVDMAQPGVRVAANLFEPGGYDALVRWDYFDAAFEQKEYIESYVIEAMAREMLSNDPALANEFEAMKQDTTFAGHPERIRHWFYQRTPYFDTRQNVYPVARILDRATVDRLRRLSR